MSFDTVMLLYLLGVLVSMLMYMLYERYSQANPCSIWVAGEWLELLVFTAIWPTTLITLLFVFCAEVFTKERHWYGANRDATAQDE